MKLLETMKRIWEKLTWRRKYCPRCLYTLGNCVSNWSPCYRCEEGDQFKEYKGEEKQSTEDRNPCKDCFGAEMNDCQDCRYGKKN